MQLKKYVSKNGHNIKNTFIDENEQIWRICTSGKACHQLKSIEDFSRTRGALGRSHSCKVCDTKRAQEQHKNNPQARWANDTIRRHRKRGHIVNIDAHELIAFAKTQEYCPIDDVKLNWEVGTKNGVAGLDSPTLDRINNETEYNMSQVWIICNGCNSSKGARTLHEWLLHSEAIVEKLRLYIPKRAEIEKFAFNELWKLCVENNK